MNTEAIFTQIPDRIIHEITQAQRSIYIAVAWFTHAEIFRALLAKAQQGIAVHLLLSDDEINHRHAKIQHRQLNIGQSSVHFVGDPKADLMHHKFCVIDERIVMNGSFNWSKKAETQNHENIVITTDDTALAVQFIQQFKRIRQQYIQDNVQAAAQPDFPLQKIIKRLEILKNYILLEDDDDIQRERGKLQEYVFHEKISQIVQALQQHQFSQAIALIDAFVKSQHQLVAVDAVEIAALKLEIRYLEHQINAYDNEKAELEQQLSQFQHRHAQELGDLILEILALQKQLAEQSGNQAEIDEAERMEQEYQEDIEQEKAKHVFDLSPDEQQTLKQAFRKASMLCHPDRVHETMRERAQEIFVSLKKAYDENDLAGVEKILGYLQRGDFDVKLRSEISQLDQLKSLVMRLRAKVRPLEAEIFAIKESDEYQEICQIDDWDDYFAECKVQFQQEIDELRARVG